ncbi:MAG TPA: hypothetical protein EYG60_05390 [Campylobacterales bacterium]|nr:hypothetical protein [Campylobacterales bacterium]
MPYIGKFEKFKFRSCFRGNFHLDEVAFSVGFWVKNFSFRYENGDIGWLYLYISEMYIRNTYKYIS